MDFNKLLKETIGIEKRLAHISRRDVYKLTASAFVKEALQIAGLDESKAREPTAEN